MATLSPSSPPPHSPSSARPPRLSRPPSSFLPLLRNRPSIGELLEALKILRRYDHEVDENGGEDALQILLDADPYEKDLTTNWLNRLLVSDLDWLRGTTHGGTEGVTSLANGAREEASAASLSNFSSFDETVLYIIDECAALLQRLVQRSETGQGSGLNGSGADGRGGLEDEQCLERVFRFPFDFSRPNAILKVEEIDRNSIRSGKVLAAQSNLSRDVEGGGVYRYDDRPIVVTLVDAPLPPSQGAPSGRACDLEASSLHATFSSSSSTTAALSRQLPASLEASSAVGVQTWAASIILSDLLVTRPGEIHSSLVKLDAAGTATIGGSASLSADIPYSPQTVSQSLHIAELGAGTGLVGIVCAHVLSSNPSMDDSTIHSVVLTDYHQRVLTNLQSNVEANRSTLPASISLQVDHLDWSTYYEYVQQESSSASLSGTSSSRSNAQRMQHEQEYDLLLAADVVYDPTHASWLRATIGVLLKRTPEARAHVLNARRSEGRFGEWGLVQGTDEVFGQVWKDEGGEEDGEGCREKTLRVLQRVELPRVKGLGRADERGHIWWTLGWR